MGGVINFIISGLFLVISWFVALTRQKQRVEGMKAIAQELGFTYEIEATDKILSLVEDFELFSRRYYSKQVKDLLAGTINGYNVYIFDYNYIHEGSHRTEKEESRNTYFQTVVLISDESANFPQFVIKPRRLGDWVQRWIGWPEIEFPDRTLFAKYYRLRGNHEEPIRQCFHSQVLGFYESHVGLCTEAKGSRWLYYPDSTWADPELGLFGFGPDRNQAVVPIEYLRTFLAEALEAFEVFRLQAS